MAEKSFPRRCRKVPKSLHDASETAPRRCKTTQDVPKTPQDAPKTAQDAPPNAPKTIPKGPQGDPKSPANGPRSSQDAPRCPRTLPRRLQAPPGLDFGTVLDDFDKILGSFWEDFRVMVPSGLNFQVFFDITWTHFWMVLGSI